MKWLQVVITVPVSDDESEVGRVCVGPAEAEELEVFAEGLRRLARDPIHDGIRIVLFVRKFPPPTDQQVHAYAPDPSKFLMAMIREGTERHTEKAKAAAKAKGSTSLVPTLVPKKRLG